MLPLLIMRDPDEWIWGWLQYHGMIVMIGQMTQKMMMLIFSYVMFDNFAHRSKKATQGIN